MIINQAHKAEMAPKAFYYHCETGISVYQIECGLFRQVVLVTATLLATMLLPIKLYFL